MLKGLKYNNFFAPSTNKLIKNLSNQDLDGKKDTLSQSEYRRYGRHLIMPEVGLEGQLRLKSSKVLVVGAGGLGSPCSLYLVAAGVGTLGIIDYDTIDESNLHRQILYNDEDIGSPKAKTASTKLMKVNPNVKIKIYGEKLNSENVLQIFKEYDVIVDGTDNFPTRYLTNDACVILGKPNIYASIFRFEGQVSVFYPTLRGPCYRCLYPKPPPPGVVPSCAEGGVLGLLPGLVGLVQATEAVKIILGIGESLVGRLLMYDALTMRFDDLQINKNPNCAVCGPNHDIIRPIDYNTFCGIAEDLEIGTVTTTQLSLELKQGKDILLLDVREPREYELVHIEGSKLIPLNEITHRLAEIDSSRDIVVYCHSGARSQRATDFLKKKGYKKVRNLSGGIDEWATKIDPKMPRY